jgi:hypothetical protein
MYAYRQSYELEKPCRTNSSYIECCMLLDKEHNSYFKSGNFAYGLLCVLSFTTSIWNYLLGKFNTFASSISYTKQTG